MATLAEVTAAIDEFNQAETAAVAAQTNLATVEAAVNVAIAQELVTFSAAQTLFNDQLQLARDAAGFPDAVTAVQLATDALAVADSTLKALMAEYSAV